MHARRPAVMPSSVSQHVGAFDRFAGAAARLASRASFFAGCVAMVALWAPSYFAFGDVDTWQLVINTATTIVTFLLVALLQNAQTRADQAVQHKLNAIAEGLADLMGAHAAHGSLDEQTFERLQADRRELRGAVGLERHETSS